nr:hypothetical protein [uncultured Acinetobacter sp.]
MMKFDEIPIIKRKVQAPTADMGRLDTISTRANLERQYWAGHTAADASQVFSSLYDLGDIVKAHYIVKFSPYNDNDTKNLPLFDDELSSYLVTETNLPVLMATYNEVQIGGYYYRSLQTMSEPDLQMTLLETKDARILNSMRLWRELAVNDDGTFNLPAHYAMEVSIGVFGRGNGREDTAFERTFIIGPNLAAIDDLASSEFSSLEIPITMTPLRPKE